MSKVCRQGKHNCKGPEARKNSNMLRSRKDASVAEVERTREPDVVREGGRGHISRDTVSQNKKLAFLFQAQCKTTARFSFRERRGLLCILEKTMTLAIVMRPVCSRVREEAGWWRRGLCYCP